MRRILFLIRVSRPIIWFVLPTVYALGLHAAHAETSAAAIVQLLLLTFPLNVVGCGLNDIYDFESDRLSARRARIWGVVVDEKTRPLVWRTAIAMTPVILSGSLFTANVWNIAATAGLLATAWAYSVPPVRFKERPPLDSLTNGVGYFLLPFVMGYSLGENPANMPFRYYLLALCVAGIHALAAAADYDVDLEPEREREDRALPKLRQRADTLARRRTKHPDVHAPRRVIDAIDPVRLQPMSRAPTPDEHRVEARQPLRRPEPRRPRAQLGDARVHPRELAPHDRGHVGMPDPDQRRPRPQPTARDLDHARQQQW
jgi:hypothetical protein